VPEPVSEAKSLPTLATELWELVRTYALQQTVEPMKGVGRYVIYGALGSIMLGLGLVLLSLAGLRALQDETGTTFHGNWSWVPYIITFLGCTIVIVLALTRTRARKRAT
jgi:hypothetical protein